MGFTFEQVMVWQRALDFTVAVQEATQTFPNTELLVLTAPLKRAADAIALNIAERLGRATWN